MLPYQILCALGELFVVFQAVIFFFLNHFFTFVGFKCLINFKQIITDLVCNRSLITERITDKQL